MKPVHKVRGLIEEFGVVLIDAPCRGIAVYTDKPLTARFTTEDSGVTCKNCKRVMKKGAPDA